MSDQKYTMSINLQVLNHLGLNLYSNTSAVLSEAVANAWDADATEVRIDIKEDEIRISDNGNGMDLQDINDKYLTVGYQKRTYSSITPKLQRSVMGRKGIGKLSLFSIANNIKVYSEKDRNKNGFEIDSDDLKTAINLNRDYHPKDISVDEVDFVNSGTLIVLTQLKKKRTASLAKFLKQRIARRFAVIGEKNDFQVFVNDDIITISDRNYLSKAQCIWMYLPLNENDEYKAELESQLKANQLKLKEERSSIISLNGNEYSLSGWIATCREPKELSDDDNLNRIVIMVRGKMAKEDVFSEIGTTALYSKYIFGEIHADFLDLDSEADITTSSRQDFFEDDERYVALKAFIENELSFIRSGWENIRSAGGEEEACKYEVVKAWYDDLKGDDKRSAKKLFGKINQLTIDGEEKRTLFKHAVLAFESFKLKNDLDQLDSISTDNIAAFIEVAGRLDNIEATMYYQIVQERLAVIRKMNDVVEDGSLEVVIQDHLSKNLWLLDPSWDRGTEAPTIEKAFKTQLDVINAGLTKEELDARLDIRYKKASNKHLIIELKRGDRIVKTGELSQQVFKYFSATTKILAQLPEHEPFEIIVLIGKDLDGAGYDSKVFEATKESLKSYNCRIMYYSELLRNAEVLYRDFLDQNKHLSTLSDLISSISSDS